MLVLRWGLPVECPNLKICLLQSTRTIVARVLAVWLRQAKNGILQRWLKDKDNAIQGENILRPTAPAPVKTSLCLSLANILEKRTRVRRNARCIIDPSSGL